LLRVRVRLPWRSSAPMTSRLPRVTYLPLPGRTARRGRASYARGRPGGPASGVSVPRDGGPARIAFAGGRRAQLSSRCTTGPPGSSRKRVGSPSTGCQAVRAQRSPSSRARSNDTSHERTASDGPCVPASRGGCWPVDIVPYIWTIHRVANFQLDKLHLLYFIMVFLF